MMCSLLLRYEVLKLVKILLVLWVITPFVLVGDASVSGEYAVSIFRDVPPNDGII
jgi:hypothetical protein